MSDSKEGPTLRLGAGRGLRKAGSGPGSRLPGGTIRRVRGGTSCDAPWTPGVLRCSRPRPSTLSHLQVTGFQETRAWGGPKTGFSRPGNGWGGGLGRGASAFQRGREPWLLPRLEDSSLTGPAPPLCPSLPPPFLGLRELWGRKRGQQVRWAGFRTWGSPPPLCPAGSGGTKPETPASQAPGPCPACPLCSSPSMPCEAGCSPLIHPHWSLSFDALE